jgi:TolB protein
MDRLGGNEYQLAGDGWSPVWSPDGTQVLYAAHVQRPELFIANWDGTDPRKITDEDGLRGKSDWSIRDLIATAWGADWNREIYTLTPQGSTPAQVGTAGGNSQAPAFSPDGQWMVFMSYFDKYGDGHGCEIYIMWTDGSHLRRLTDNDFCDWQPRWGP